MSTAFNSTTACNRSPVTSEVRVLLVDDSAAVREGLRSLLDLLAGVEVVGEAGSGVEALEQAERLRPDVLLLDLEMPVMDGLTAAPLLKRLLPGCRLVALTVHSAEADRRRAQQAGIDDYVVKGAPVSALAEALQGGQRARPRS